LALGNPVNCYCKRLSSTGTLLLSACTRATLSYPLHFHLTPYSAKQNQNKQSHHGVNFSSVLVQHLLSDFRHQRAPALAHAFALAVRNPYLEMLDAKGLTHGSVSNLKRRVAGLPAESHEEYHTTHPVPKLAHRSDAVDHKKRLSSSPLPAVDSDSESESEQESDLPPSTTCLFCPHDSPDVATNFTHMSSTHGLLIPSFCDISTFLGDLATLVFQYNECVYCGASKGNVDSVQTHMRDKGHCKIRQDPNEDSSLNLNRLRISKDEMRLPNGNIINSRSSDRPGLAHCTRSRTRVQRNDQRAITANAETRHETRIAVRGEMGVTGLTTEQRRALMSTEKKAKTREAIAEKKGRQRMVQAPVLTKYYKVC
jgi:pre-60S factor REI1